MNFLCERDRLLDFMAAVLSKDSFDRLVNSSPNCASPRVKKMQMRESDRERRNWSKRLGHLNRVKEARFDINGIEMNDMDTISEVCALPGFAGGTRLQRVDPYISENLYERLPSHHELQRLRKRKGFGPSPKEVERYPEPKFNRESACPTPVKSTVAIALDKSGRL